MLTFDREAELALFKRLAGDPKLVEWVRWKLEAEKESLVSKADVDQIRKAQGKAQLLQNMVALLEAHKHPPR